MPPSFYVDSIADDNDAGHHSLGSSYSIIAPQTDESSCAYLSGPGHRSSRTGCGNLSNLLRYQPIQDQSPLIQETRPSRQSLPVDVLHEKILPAHVHGDQRHRYTSLPTIDAPDLLKHSPDREIRMADYSPPIDSQCSPHIPERPLRPRFPHVDSEFIRRGSGGSPLFEKHQRLQAELEDDGYTPRDSGEEGLPHGISSWAWPAPTDTRPRKDAAETEKVDMDDFGGMEAEVKQKSELELILKSLGVQNSDDNSDRSYYGSIIDSEASWSDDEGMGDQGKISGRHT
ncbi:hypothetical protein EW146_g2288 [Bondarzewia mesenterica]|uniref:Uncharacterized protein n=1 Tax=Bondarzewia mesenterica TaxID=1095465 RepID=A0A4S4M308_9AGAM|nr:hypothetical protein EW146_g2288 [Bondarzewia mesenterica]